jgi:hypothetical protein
MVRKAIAGLALLAALETAAGFSAPLGVRVGAGGHGVAALRKLPAVRTGAGRVGLRMSGIKIEGAKPGMVPQSSCVSHLARSSACGVCCRCRSARMCPRSLDCFVQQRRRSAMALPRRARWETLTHQLQK